MFKIGPIDFLVQNMMIPFLTFSYNHIYPNYGMAIVLLTLLIKTVFYPLTDKQYKSMKIMQKIQPRLKEIQDKFKDKPEKLQKEIMQFYKENKVNPLSGCLPLLIQLPFLFAIFYTVNSALFKGMISAPGINPGFLPFWLSNLAMPDKTFILPLVVAGSTYLSQKLSVTDPNQAKIMMIMPFVMFFICMKMPAGVLLYWSSSQVLSTLQQYWIMKKNS